jgi:hypothetical protein
MAKYEITDLSYVNGALRQVGDVVDYDGEPAANLKPLDKAASKAASSVLPRVVQTLVSEARLQAVARGDSPDNANSGDLEKAASMQGGVPSPDVVAAATAALASLAAAAVALG